MKIIYAIRNNYIEKKGGDTFQMLTTRLYIVRNYNDVTIEIVGSASEIEKKSGFDFLHVFNMQNYEFAMECINAGKKMGLKIILSPVYWDLSDSIYVTRMLRITDNLEFIRKIKFAKKMININIPTRYYMGMNYKKKYHKLLEKVDMLLPNSDEEGVLIEKFFGKHNFLVKTVPNAIITNHSIEHTETKEYSFLRECVVEVGRIEPTKNQLGVLMASMKENYPLVFVGAVNKEYAFYYEKLKKLAEIRGNVYFMGEKKQEELEQIYKMAKVHVLPSFRESPGLVSLEALYYNCNIVVAQDQYCPVKYYKFNKYAYLCDPYSIESIHNAVLHALREPLRLTNRKYFEDYSYNKVSKCTYEAYKLLM